MKFSIVFCLALCPSLTFADPPKQPPTSRSQLSPLAKAIDDMLFRGRSSARWNNSIFSMAINKENWAAAIEEVRAFRGKEFEDLGTKGKEINDTFSDKIRTGAVQELKKAGAHLNPISSVATSWMLLTSTGTSGERPLTDPEVEVRARTALQTLSVASGGTPPTRNDPLLYDFYSSMRYRIDTQETVPHPQKLAREEFENWRANQIKNLVNVLTQNTLRLLAKEYREGDYVYRASQPSPQPIPLQELMEEVGPPEVIKKFVGDSVFYSVGDELNSSRLGRLVLGQKNLHFKQRSWKRTVFGELNLEKGIDDHVQDLINAAPSEILEGWMFSVDFNTPIIVKTEESGFLLC